VKDLPGLPAAPLDAWLRATRPDLHAGGPWTAEVISGGLSNITYRLHLPTGTVILRRPPLGPLLPSAHDMAREHRVLTALHPTVVPVPLTHALCTNAEVVGAPFYVMAEARGDILRTAQDTAALTPAARGELAESFVGVLADLHGVDPDVVGLGDYGRPAGFIARQLRRWAEQWSRSRTRDLPDMDTLLARLVADQPSEQSAEPAQPAATVVHGDYRLDNTVVDLTGPPRVVAVLDWELSTLGDPLADLAMTMTYWQDPGDDSGPLSATAGATAQPGFPTRAELAQAYARRTGRDLSRLPFYLGFSAMKLAVILEGVHARYLNGQTVSSGYERAGPAVPALVARGLAQLDQLDPLD
jgi:aminoglycoside phosphotransferase (APT) family kinase protein